MKTLVCMVLALTSAELFAAEQAGALSGKVLETMDAGGYTYLKIKTSGGDQWAAVPQTQIKVGADVGIDNPMKMTGFESKRLKRTFNEIFFGTLGGAQAAEKPQAMGAGSMRKSFDLGKGASDPHAGAGNATNVDLGSIKVAKAEGSDGKTVAEVFGQKASLKDKKISVRGKVVKVNPAIMGKNWIHIQDGSGAVKDGNFDLLFTTKDLAKVGDIVVAKGTVHLDRDLGAGYKYSILVEDATITK